MSMDVLITEDERNLLAALRALPEGELKRRVWSMLTGLCGMLHDPHCTQSQADGVPCARPDGNCAQCARVLRELEELPATALPS